LLLGEATKFSYDQPMMYPCDTHMTPSVFIDRLERLGVDLPSFDRNLIPIKGSKSELMKKAADRGEPINITKDFLVAFLAFGNLDHCERGSQRLSKVVSYFQTMLHGMVDSGNFLPAEFCEFCLKIFHGCNYDVYFRPNRLTFQSLGNSEGTGSASGTFCYPFKACERTTLFSE